MKRLTTGPYEEDEEDEEDSGTPPLDAGLTAEKESEQQSCVSGNASRRAVTVMPSQQCRYANLGDAEEDRSGSCSEEEEKDGEGLEDCSRILERRAGSSGSGLGRESEGADRFGGDDQGSCDCVAGWTSRDEHKAG